MPGFLFSPYENQDQRNNLTSDVLLKSERSG